MATISQIFINTLNEGVKASKAIADPEKKALVCAELAKAIAMTGLVSATTGDSQQEQVSPKDSLKDDKKVKEEVKEIKEEAKEEVKEIKEEVKEEVKETQKPKNKVDIRVKKEEKEEVAEEVELTDEWTQEAVALKTEQLDFISQIREEYDEEALDDCVANFSEGVLKTIDDITPLNIDGFVSYLQMLLNSDEQAS